MIPILLQHDPSHPIGKIEVVDGKMMFRFDEGVHITREMFFDVFRHVGFGVVEATSVDGVVFIKSGTIIEFSL